MGQSSTGGWPSCSDSENRHLAFCGTSSLICSKRGVSCAPGGTLDNARDETGGDHLKQETARRILVVDDNGDAAALLAVLLRLEGHEVQTAANGSEAVEIAEQFRPEIVLMDLDMPGVDGLEASRRIRARPWGNTVLIAALTGWGGEADRLRAREAGVDLHFLKPVNTESLMAALTQSLNSPRSGSGANNGPIQ